MPNTKSSHSDTDKRIQELTEELASTKQSLARVQDNAQAQTSKYETEDALEKAILASIGEGVFATDTNGSVILANYEAEKLSWFTRSEIIGKHYAEVFRFSFEDTTNLTYPSITEDVIRTGIQKSLPDNTMLIKKNGTSIPIMDSAAPIKNANGETLGCVVVLHSQTRERELEQTKNNFISIAAHQLRTPLGSMRWNIEMLLAGDLGKLPEAARDSLLQSYESNRRMINLVNNLLNASRIDGGIMKDGPELMRPEEMGKTVVHEVDIKKKKRSEKVEVQTKTVIPQLYVDPNRFHEIILNLVSNAVKYNRIGGKVTITLVVESNLFQVSIADEGLGIPTRDFGKIFSKFFRAENAVLSETEGSGLGLFVVKSYVEAWGGKVWFESKEGKGTAFNFSIPITDKIRDKNFQP